MKISARNVLAGRVKQVTTGAVNSEVIVLMSGGEEVVSIITNSSAQRLNLKAGAKVQVIVKGSNVMLAVE